MENVDLLFDLAIAMTAALLGGFVAHRFGQPVILGYLVAGVLVGPHTPGLVASEERVQTLANLGVALLMFALGVEFSVEALRRVRMVAVYGGIVQILATIALGTVLGVALGYSLPASIFLGGIISISSSILMLKLLLARGEVEAIVGRVALGTGIVQDIVMVALIVILPSLSAGIGPELLSEAGLAILKGGVFLALAYLLGTRLVPPLLAVVARAGSRELFLLTVVAIAAGMAVLGHFVGISFALGAFVGGLVVSESEFSNQVIDEIIPVRDIFATLFFVSIGMLMEPTYLVSHSLEVGLLVAAILLGKFVIAAVVIRMFGYPRRVALRTGLMLAQIGEFSFVLAGVGLARGALTPDLYALVLSAALVSLILNPLLVSNASRLARASGTLTAPIRSLLPASRFLTRPQAGIAESDTERLAALKRHVIICGFGRVGQEVARALARRSFLFVVVDYSPTRIEAAQREGYLCVQGDTTNPAVLSRAGIATARMVAVTLPDLPSAEKVIGIARQASKRALILVRAGDARSIAHLKRAGANEVIQPEFEAGLEMVRHALRSHGVSSLETQTAVGGRRQEHYAGDLDTHYSDDSPWS